MRSRQGKTAAAQPTLADSLHGDLQPESSRITAPDTMVLALCTLAKDTFQRRRVGFLDVSVGAKGGWKAGICGEGSRGNGAGGD